MKWERYLAGMREYGLLKFVIVILALGLVIEGFFLMQLSRQQRIVLVPPGISASGGEDQQIWVSDRGAGAGYLEEMTRYLLPLVASFHPRNLDTQLGLFLRYVAPEQYGAVKAQLLSQAERAVKNDLSQVFYIQQVEVKGSTARATGILKRFVGKTQTSEEVSSYEVTYKIRHGRPVVVGIELVPPAGLGASDRHRP
jgi:conjugal transfer pilus assembly protein TraE